VSLESEGAGGGSGGGIGVRGHELEHFQKNLSHSKANDLVFLVKLKNHRWISKYKS
jgi:hypothetical protein